MECSLHHLSVLALRRRPRRNRVPASSASRESRNVLRTEASMILFRQRSDVHKQQADGIMLIQPEGYRREYEDDRRNEVYRKYAARTGGAGDKIAIDGLKKLSTTTTAIVRKGIDTANVLTGTIRRGVRETTRLTTSLVPGLLSPLVVLFELPGLTEHW